MSKPISFGFARVKDSAPTVSKPQAPKPISKSQTNRPLVNSARGALRNDSDEEDDALPKAESVTGFGSSGAILSEPREEKQEKVIVNAGNSDWRKRGRKNLLPTEVQAAQTQTPGNQLVAIEHDEASTTFGLQFAPKTRDDLSSEKSLPSYEDAPAKPLVEMTQDEKALQALLDPDSRPKSTATISNKGNIQLRPVDETADFREDVASRPESATLEEYAAMPVEEFGMAMLRGMGQKRRANGEVIDLSAKRHNERDQKRLRNQQDLLGIGAKPVRDLERVELGAWGRADMRKNQKGEGFFTPVMVEDKRTGERITEEEFERRKQEANRSEKEQDWRTRRDRNLNKDRRDPYDDEVNGISSDSRQRSRDTHQASHSPRGRDNDDRYRGHPKSRRDRSRSKGRYHHSDDDSDDHRWRDKQRARDETNADDNYSSSSSRRHRDHDRNHGRHSDRRRDYDRDDGLEHGRDRHRDRDKRKYHDR